MDDLALIIKDFLVETSEHLDRLDSDVMALEAHPGSSERLSSAFRAFHTIKGTCAWLGFAQLEALAHSAESLLGALRDGGLTFDKAIASSLLRAGNVVRSALPVIESTQSEGELDVTALRAELEAYGAHPSDAPPVDEDPLQVWSSAFETEEAVSAIADRTVRVDVHVLDTLMNHVGELVLARNQIIQGVPAATQRLRTITAELQQAVMKARLQPIGTVWNNLARLAREAALGVNKDVKLVLAGQDTEVDRSLLQAVRDPMTHLVRNAIDHGIEAPAERVLAGKPAFGTIRIAAYHQNGQVVVEVADDGAGLDVPRIKGVAVARKLITTQQAMLMSERELTQLVFKPGFSTRQAVSNLSGRGVGLDVVKTHVEGIGGSIEIESTRGTGTTIRLKMPLTLAIIQSLSVRCGGLRFAVTQNQVVELVRVAAQEAARTLEHVHDAMVLRLRGALIPLVDLSGLLGMKPFELPDPDSDAAVTIIVVEAARQRFGIIVDGVADSEEIVVKPLARQLKALQVYSGTTVMSDGRVGLILDTHGIASRARILLPESDAPIAAPLAVAAPIVRRYLIAATRDGGQIAVPLELVHRLEELSPESIETVGTHEVVQYRGSILPLVRLRDVLEERRRVSREKPKTETETVATIVCHSGKKQIGVIVDRIVDVLDDTTGIVGPATRKGITGTVVAFGKVAELLDLAQVMA